MWKTFFKFLDSSYSWRKHKFAQLIKPPQPIFNINKKKINELIKDPSSCRKRVLDLGSGGRCLGENVINFDIDVFEHVDLIGDAHNLPFLEGTFDLIIATAILEHIPYPNTTVNEINRCLKVNGIVYAEIPFLQGYHADPYDFQRFTIDGVRVLFSDFKEEDVGVCAGPMSVLAWYLRKLPTIFLTNHLANKIIEFFSGWMVSVVSYLDYFLVRAKNAHTLASGLYYLGSKMPSK